MKRFIVDWVGNYLFFVPLVVLFNGPAWGWSWDIIQPYIITSILFAAVSGRLFMVFLKKFWYPLCKEKF